MKASIQFRRGHLLLPPVRIEHRRSSSPMMAIDTGARITLITPRVAEEVGLDWAAVGPRVQLVGVTGVTNAVEVQLKRVFLMGLGVDNVRAICYPLPPRLGLDGILGLNFLQYFNLDINHDTETVTVERSAHSA